MGTYYFDLFFSTCLRECSFAGIERWTWIDEGSWRYRQRIRNCHVFPNIPKITRLLVIHDGALNIKASYQTCKEEANTEVLMFSSDDELTFYTPYTAINPPFICYNNFHDSYATLCCRIVHSQPKVTQNETEENIQYWFEINRL